MNIKTIEQPGSAIPPEGSSRLPDHLDLPPAEPRTDDASPWCWPDHTMLPDQDGNPVKNTQEPPQSALLTECIRPLLQRLHPDGSFLIGQDLGIYWRLTEPPLRGAIAPDWFYVPGVPPRLAGLMRRSYVLWKEEVPPLLVLEYVSGDGALERDQTPETGKFWIYEQRIRALYYGIYEVNPGRVELFHLVENHYLPLSANARGHFEILSMNAELGIWHGQYQDEELPWLRWWDLDGIILPTGEESAEQERQRAEQQRQRAEQERQRADQERQRAEQERQRADQAVEQARRLADKLRSLGIDPDAI